MLAYRLRYSYYFFLFISLITTLLTRISSTTPPRPRVDLIRMPRSVPSKTQLLMVTFFTPPLISLPITTPLDELMYTMHNHEDVPGYGFQQKFGATTLTEQWDPRQGSSWNHFMMGQIDEWFFKSLAGIRSAKPGMSEIILSPVQ